MKKFTNLFFVLTLALLMLPGCKEKQSEPTPAPEPEPEPAEYVSVSRVSLSRRLYAFTAEGQTFQLTAKVYPTNATNQKVTWKSSNPDIATVSDDGLVTCTGFGNTTITATAEDKSDTSPIYTCNGTVTDACGNKYKCVVIDYDRYNDVDIWMVENMRCNKYDTQSERAGAEVIIYSYNNPKDGKYGPYCVDASEKRNWSSDEYAGKLSATQIEKLGYHYSWAAAVGIESGPEAIDIYVDFEGNRQGICPNGWHVPKEEEWDGLEAFISYDYAGRELKSASGWYNDGNGTDNYSFTALPAGTSYGSVSSNVGTKGCFWTTTSVYEYAYSHNVYHESDILWRSQPDKSYALSVRCVMNIPKPYLY